MSIGKVSVVMATYNGEKYIFNQLESLRMQNYSIDEVIICDDCSTDKTLGIIQKYILTNSLTTWSVEQNTKNLGWKQTFWNLLHEAHYDFIFLSDQDDIWNINKINLLRSIMFKNQEIQLLASAFTPFYKNNINLLLNEGSDSNNDIRIDKLAFVDNFLKVTHPGCSFVIRKTLVSDADSYWSKNQPHDFVLWNTALLNSGAYLLNQSLIYWRVHHTSADFSRKYSVREMILNPVNVHHTALIKKKQYIDFNLSFLSECIQNRNNKYFSIVFTKYNFLTLRKKYLVEHSFFLFFRSFLKYNKNYHLKMCLGDIYFIFGSKIFGSEDIS